MGENFITMSRDEVRNFDRWAIEDAGIAGLVLMENAGRGAAEVMLERLEGGQGRSVCVFCGAGNNGGDGYVIARHLANSGSEVRVVLCAKREKIGGDALSNLVILERLGFDIVSTEGHDVAAQVHELVEGMDLVVDAMFGTGLRGALRGEGARIVEALNGCGVEIAAVDIPSGMDCDTGRAEGVCVRAGYTVTFAGIKQGFSQEEAREFTGEVYCRDIGVSPRFRGK